MSPFSRLGRRMTLPGTAPVAPLPRGASGEGDVLVLRPGQMSVVPALTDDLPDLQKTVALCQIRKSVARCLRTCGSSAPWLPDSRGEPRTEAKTPQPPCCQCA